MWKIWNLIEYSSLILFLPPEEHILFKKTKTDVVLGVVRTV